MGTITAYQTNNTEAVRAYARQVNDTEMVSWASEIKLRAMRRMGELLKETERATGAMGIGKSGVESPDSTPTLTEMGVSRNASSLSQKIAAVPGGNGFEVPPRVVLIMYRECPLWYHRLGGVIALQRHYNAGTYQPDPPLAKFDPLGACGVLNFLPRKMLKAPITITQISSSTIFLLSVIYEYFPR